MTPPNGTVPDIAAVDLLAFLAHHDNPAQYLRSVRSSAAVSDALTNEVQQRLARAFTTLAEKPRTGDGYSVVMTPYTDITAEKTTWLWDKRIPANMLSLFVGTEGLGKTALELELASQATLGTLPGCHFGTPVNVALFTPEDSAGATIKGRLAAAGADMARVFDVKMKKDEHDRGFSLPDDTDLLLEALEQFDIRFGIGDPFASMLDPKRNSWKDTDIRSALEGFIGGLERTRTTFLGTLHTNKTASNDARQRGMGSAGWRQIARATFVVGLDPDDPSGADGSSRCVAHDKHNLGPWMPTLRFSLDETTVAIDGEDFTTVHAVLGDECEHRASDLLAAEAGVDDKVRGTKINEAMLFVVRHLSDGPKAATWMHETADHEGIARRTLRRAFDKVGAAANQVEGGGWVWSLPESGLDFAAEGSE